MRWYGFILGLFYGVVFTVIGSAAASFFTTVTFGSVGPTDVWNSFQWFVLVAIVPVAITFAVIGIKVVHSPFRRWSAWIIAIISGYLTILFAGTYGAIFSTKIQRGSLDHINVQGYFEWGPRYALILLPLTACAEFAAIKGLTLILSRLKKRSSNNRVT